MDDFDSEKTCDICGMPLEPDDYLMHICKYCQEEQYEELHDHQEEMEDHFEEREDDLDDFEERKDDFEDYEDE